ncbi:MAG: hypothetical protein PHN72_06825 [Bacilli bacterium]|nr:hypothetical protein [Bacilli bacterium]
MKKKVFLGLLIGLFGILAGCSAKKASLSCQKEDTSMIDMKTAQTYTITFKKNKIARIETSSTIKVDGVYKKYTKELLESLEQQFATVKDKKGVTVKPNKSEDKVSIKATLEVTKMEKETKESFTMLGLYLDKVDEAKTKKGLEDQGFTCK